MNQQTGTSAGSLAALERRGLPYSLQKVYVRFMLWLIGRLLQAASGVDEEIRTEVRSLPEGFSFAMRVRSGSTGLAVVKKGGRLQAVPAATAPPPTLTFEFKHVALAFLVLSFQESTPRAFANDRLSVDGEFPSAMKMLRVLNRMQAVVLPRFVAVRAVKRYPPIRFIDKWKLAARIYARLCVDFFKRKPE